MGCISRYVHQRLRSFACAGRGVALTFVSQAHAKIHVLAALVVAVLGVWYAVSPLEWCVLLLCIGLVWVAETLNTAIEFCVDLISPQHHPLAGKAKDVAAGAVLLAAATSVVVAGIIFVPRWATS